MTGVMIELCKDTQDVNVQVEDLKALKRETNIPLVQLLDSQTTLIPGDAANRVSSPSLHLAQMFAAASMPGAAQACHDNK